MINNLVPKQRVNSNKKQQLFIGNMQGEGSKWSKNPKRDNTLDLLHISHAKNKVHTVFNQWLRDGVIKLLKVKQEPMT